MHTQEPWGIIGPGASGDWFRKEILPSLSELEKANKIHFHSKVLGISRGITLQGQRFATREAFHDFVRKSVGEVSNEFLDRFYFYSADIAHNHSWHGISRFCNDEIMSGLTNRAVVISTAPSLVPNILHGIKESSLLHRNGKNVLLLEKPFGHNAQTCDRLFSQAHEAFGDEVYPIDHYRGKIGILQLACMRREDPFLSLMYNHHFIESVTILAEENDHLNDRANTYVDMRCGVGSDMWLTHLLTTALTMAQPAESLRENADRTFVRSNQLNLLQEVQISDCVWGQYTDGENVIGLSKLHPNDKRYARTPTFFSCKLVFNRGELAGIPFYIRTGKGLHEKRTEILIRLKKSSVSTRDSNRDIRFILHKQTENGIVQDAVVLPHTVRDAGITHDTRPLQIPVFSKANESIRFRPYAKLLDSAMQSNWRDFIDPLVLKRLWEIAEPVFSEYESAVLSDLQLPVARRSILHAYPYGSTGPSACTIGSVMT